MVMYSRQKIRRATINRRQIVLRMRHKVALIRAGRPNHIHLRLTHMRRLISRTRVRARIITHVPRRQPLNSLLVSRQRRFLRVPHHLVYRQVTISLPRARSAPRLVALNTIRTLNRRKINLRRQRLLRRKHRLTVQMLHKGTTHNTSQRMVTLAILTRRRTTTPRQRRITNLNRRHSNVTRTMPHNLMLLCRLILNKRLPNLPRLANVSATSRDHNRFTMVLDRRSSCHLVPPSTTTPVATESATSRSVVVLSRGAQLFRWRRMRSCVVVMVSYTSTPLVQR